MTQILGKVAVGVDDPAGKPLATVVIVPPFGIRAGQLFLASYALTQNGFRVVRFDPRNHVGLSEGSIESFRLSLVVEDLQSVLAWSKATIILGFSLAAPAVLRVLSEQSRVVAAILVAPVVSVRSTLKAILGKDFFSSEAGELPQTTDILGARVATPGFITDCREHNYAELSDSIRDANCVSATLVLLAGAQDPWVQLEDVRACAKGRSPDLGITRMITVPVASHQFSVNPTVAMRYLEPAVRECINVCGSIPNPVVRIPPLKEAIAAERRQYRSISGSIAESVGRIGDLRGNSRVNRWE
jgi:pimeloyl-ACP methyl ester carboxylesterase